MLATLRRRPVATLVSAAALGLTAVALVSGTSAAGGADGPSSAAGTKRLTRFALANRCFTISPAATGGFVAVDGAAGYTADASKPDAARFYLKPTRLGHYLLYDQGRGILAVDGAAVSRIAEAGPSAEWAPSGSKGGFRLRSTVGGQWLTVDPGSGEVGLDGPDRATRLKFLATAGCKRFPEARTGASGTPFRGRRPNGTVLGFADYHLHVTSDLRAGGSVISGRNFARFGIPQALGRDDQVHGPDGSLDVTGNLLRSGSPTGTHDTHGWPTFKGWPVHDTYTHQQTYYVWLKRAWEAGERLVVAQTAEDEPLCNIEPIRTHSCDEMETIKLEIQRLRQLEAYVDAQSGGPGKGWFRLVYNPTQARRVIERGKLAVVIGMETSDALGCSEFEGAPQCTKEDIDAGIREMRRAGLRSMFISHWVDNAFGGVALQSGATGEFISVMQAEQTGQPFDTEPCAGAADEAEGTCNTKGLTDLGAYLVHRLIANRMLIDVDHLSQKSREAVLQIAEKEHYPLISSHTGTGGAWTPSQLRRLYELGGLATARLDQAPELAKKVDGLSRYRSSRNYFGVGIGSDTGGFNSTPGPLAGGPKLRYPFKAAFCSVALTRQRTGRRKFDLNKDGVAHYGLLADLLAEMRHEKGGKLAQRTVFRSAEAYLDMWSRAYGHRR